MRRSGLRLPGLEPGAMPLLAVARREHARSGIRTRASGLEGHCPDQLDQPRLPGGGHASGKGTFLSGAGLPEVECGCHRATRAQCHRSEPEATGQQPGGRLRTHDGDDRVADPDLGSQVGVVQQAGDGGQPVAVAACQAEAGRDRWDLYVKPFRAGADRQAGPFDRHREVGVDGKLGALPGQTSQDCGEVGLGVTHARS